MSGHIHEKIDFAVSIYIVYENKVFLRVHDKLKIWLPVGGHIELHEDPNQAALREAKEESGLDVVLYGTSREPIEKGLRGLIPPIYLNIHDILDKHRHVGMIYFATSSSNVINPSDIDGDRSDNWKWFTRDELDDYKYPLRNEVRFYAQEALKALGK